MCLLGRTNGCSEVFSYSYYIFHKSRVSGLISFCCIMSCVLVLVIVYNN